MQIKSWCKLGFLQALIGGLFLCNPVWGFSDFLPDLFGYLLIWNGLTRLADLNDSVSESRTAFQNLIWVGLGEIVVRYLLRDAAARQTSEYQQPTWILVFSFAISVLHLWLLIPAFKNLFAGLEHLSDKHERVLSSNTGKVRCSEARLTRHSAVFVTAHAICSVLPELTILTSYEYHEANIPFDWYSYINLFRTVGVVIASVFGLIWLIAFVRYFAAILKDHAWLERLEAAYADEILPQEAMLRTRRLTQALLMLSVGVLFTLSLRMDEQVALSGIFFALAVGGSAFYLGELLPSRRICRTPCIVLGVVGFANALTKYLYLQQYSVEASAYYTDAFWFFAVTQILEILEAAATLLVLFVAMRLLSEIVTLYTNVDYGAAGEGSELLSQRATAALHRSFEKRSILIRTVFSLAAVGYMFDAVLQLTVDWLWLCPFALSLLGIFLFLSYLHELSTQLRWKYQSDTTYRRD